MIRAFAARRSSVRSVLLLAVASATGGAGCSMRRDAPRPLPPGDASPASASADASDDLRRIARAEDRRRAADVPPEAARSADVGLRRASARAYARILEPGDETPLLSALEDDDRDVVAWAAYGLGESCRGHEEVRVRAIAARLASLEAAGTASRGSPGGGAPPPNAGETPALAAIPVALRALGRCGGALAEGALVPWLRAEPRAAEAAAYAMGDVAERAGTTSLSTTAATALLDAAQAPTPLDAALYPFSRGDRGAPLPRRVR
jgi:hypothetical protein